jgi:hypothetical protein
LPCSIKAKKASGFQKPALFHKVMQVLESHHFRLPVCRFVIDLFDKRVLRQIVLEEDDNDDEGSDDDDSDSDAEHPVMNGGSSLGL